MKPIRVSERFGPGEHGIAQGKNIYPDLLEAS